MGYYFHVEYEKGGENIVVDALSHRYDAVDAKGMLHTFSQLIPHWVEAI